MVSCIGIGLGMHTAIERPMSCHRKKPSTLPWALPRRHRRGRTPCKLRMLSQLDQWPWHTASEPRLEKMQAVCQLLGGHSSCARHLPSRQPDHYILSALTTTTSQLHITQSNADHMRPEHLF